MKTCTQFENVYIQKLPSIFTDKGEHLSLQLELKFQKLMQRYTFILKLPNIFGFLTFGSEYI